MRRDMLLGLAILSKLLVGTVAFFLFFMTIGDLDGCSSISEVSEVMVETPVEAESAYMLPRHFGDLFAFKCATSGQFFRGIRPEAGLVNLGEIAHESVIVVLHSEVMDQSFEILKEFHEDEDHKNMESYVLNPMDDSVLDLRPYILYQIVVFLAGMVAMFIPMILIDICLGVFKTRRRFALMSSATLVCFGAISWPNQLLGDMG